MESNNSDRLSFVVDGGEGIWDILDVSTLKFGESDVVDAVDVDVCNGSTEIGLRRFSREKRKQ